MGSLSAQTSTWLGGAGAWTNPVNWSGGVPGVNSTVKIDAGNPINSAVTLSATATVKTIQIDSGDSLTLADANSLFVGNGGGKLENAGLLKVDSTGSFTDLRFSNGAEIDGGGTIWLSGVNSRLFGVNAGDVVINRNQTYAGTGALLLNAMNFQNQGTMTVEAGTNLRLVNGRLDNTGGVMKLNGNADLISATLKNGTLEGPGALRVLDGRTGTLEGTITNNTQIQVLAGGNFTDLRIANGTTLQGTGTLLLSGGNSRVFGVNASDTLNVNGYTVLGQGQLGANAMKLNNTGTLNFTGATTNMWLNASTTNNTGTIQVSDGATLRVGGLVNGTLLAKDASQMILRGTIDNATLASEGSGLIRVEDNSTAFATGKLQNLTTLKVDAGGNFTDLRFSNGAEIDGGGTIWLSGVNSRLFGVNAGDVVINRNQTYAGTGALWLGFMNFQNQGTMTVQAGTNLRLFGGRLDNTGGVMKLNGNADLISATLKNGTLEGPGALRVMDAQTGTLEGTITNNTQIQVLSGGNFTDLRIANGTTLQGTGTLLLSGGNSRVLGVNASDTLTNNSNIAGNGQLGVSLLSIINNGTIRSEGGTLTVNPNAAGILNNGTFDVTTGSTFIVTDGLTNLVGSTLTGGTYDIEGTLRIAGANITTNAARIILDGVGSQFLNHSNGANALANLASNTAAGSLEIKNGRVFTTGAAGFSNAGSVQIGSGSQFKNSGVYSQTAGVTTVNGILDPGSVLMTGGLLEGTGVILGDVTADGGAIGPGNSPGKLRIEGNLTLNSPALLFFELAGYGQGVGYDWLDITGHASLEGSISLGLLDGFMPTTGDIFQIMTWGSRTGTFGGWTGMTLGMIRFDADYRADGLYLTATRLTDPTPPIPEPSTWTLIGLGLGALVVRQMRRQ